MYAYLRRSRHLGSRMYAYLRRSRPLGSRMYAYLRRSRHLGSRMYAYLRRFRPLGNRIYAYLRRFPCTKGRDLRKRRCPGTPLSPNLRKIRISAPCPVAIGPLPSLPLIAVYCQNPRKIRWSGDPGIETLVKYGGLPSVRDCLVAKPS